MRPFIQGEGGNTLVEFAVASIVFFMTLFGIIEFGQAVWRYNMVANLAKEGARRAVVCGKNTGLSSTDCNIQSYLTSRGLGLTVTATVTPALLSNLNAGSTVTVQVQNTFTPLTTLIPHGTLTLTSTAKMIVSR